MWHMEEKSEMKEYILDKLVERKSEWQQNPLENEWGRHGEQETARAAVPISLLK